MSGSGNSYTPINRRVVLGGLAASLPAIQASAQVIASAKDPGPLHRVTGYVLRDLANGRVIAQHQPNLSLPPASVSKIPTTLYAASALGMSHRFVTQIVATGPVQGGVVQGDLVLVGSGDPVMDTDGLANLVAQTVSAGVKGVTGRFLVFHAALPYHKQIDDGQPIDVGYNPAISGMNLNFNRVYLEWTRKSQGYDLQMTARSENFAPPVTGIRVDVAQRKSPVFTYRRAGDRDTWSVAAGALNRQGSRWLPVRMPAQYAGEVLRVLAHERGLALPNPKMTDRLPEGTVLAQETGAELGPLMRSMLRYSTNLTAEVLGLCAAQKNGNAPRNIAASAGSMSAWLRREYGLRKAKLVNHSGLSEDSRMTADEMVQVLDIADQKGVLRPLLRNHVLKDANGQKVALPGVSVAAKTGTMNYMRGLGGYLNVGPKRYAFAIFAADLAARSGRASMGGGKWLRLARGQEQVLLQSWAKQLAG
ncbi:D-alanyl-D-alanine carboxypeptidase/D-alanyl-D-alanine endopeptidase [Halovulum sp. GXIMD14793]